MPRARARHGTVVLRDGWVPFGYEFRLDRPDPLGPFLDRVLNRLTDRAAAAIAAGDALRGDGWDLSAAGLTFLERGRERTVALDEVAAVDVVEGHVCVWARGEKHPSARVPAGSANALVLLNLLDEHVKATGADANDSVGGLGRVLFERGRSAPPFVPLFVTLLFAAGAAALGWVADGAWGAAVAAGVVGSPVFLVVFLTAGNVFRCHARGVFRRSCRRSRERRFEDVSRFRYEGTRSYYNGFYVGTLVRLKFTPRPGAGGRPVTFSARVKNGDGELENLREHVSRVVAAHMLRRLGQEPSVAWVRGLRFRPEGLEWTTPGGLFSRPVTRLIPYDEVADTDVKEGHFYLYLRGIPKVVYTTPVSADNFFPGLVLLGMMRERALVGRSSW